MVKELIIAVDCDDVLVSTAQSIINNYNRRFGTNLNASHMYSPVSLEAWGTNSEDEAIGRVNDFLRSNEHAQIAPHPQAVVAIKQLAKQHKLHLITGRADFLADVTRKMIEQYFENCFISVEHTNYIVTSTSAATRRTKGEVCAAIGADILIDDHLAHGRDALAVSLKKAILFGDYPWNRGTIPDRMVRCVDWSEVLREVDRYASER